MFKRNEDIKNARGGVPYWAIAEKMNISENTLYRWLRSELSTERKEDILAAIRDCQKELAEVN
ncbi:helix-turn-helix domain-containing protein [Bacillus sp. S/N-304-OC-R1]|uniref:helix-turn-helix domain-containing protein n=1 Tax=Bacillus sp. S/N-304-OC-R1 TaxID=2758034 RepID=UPI001C8D66CB|nr:helix-turn-helix domain-containing protein [Bacillus sp. S/N-304-OC-R1]MBY0124491.1 helix-turn-helix domain-containing protein [Bacillus sp. S/N-304-OC-R1]